MLGFIEQKLKFWPPEGVALSGGRITLPGVREISLSETPLPGGRGVGQLKIAVKSVQIGRHGNGCHGDGCCGDRCQVFRGVCALVLLAPTPHSHQTPEVGHMTLT